MVCRIGLKILILYASLFIGDSRQRLECEQLKPPKNGYILGGNCAVTIGSVCALNCYNGYVRTGSTLRICSQQKTSESLDNESFSYESRPLWSGKPIECTSTFFMLS